jgi:hypothetical protein
MRLVKDRVLQAWRELKADAQQRIAKIERKQKVVREKLNRLDEAFLYERSIDIETYDRHCDKLRRSSRSCRSSTTPPSSKKST